MGNHRRQWATDPAHHRMPSRLRPGPEAKQPADRRLHFVRTLEIYCGPPRALVSQYAVLSVSVAISCDLDTVVLNLLLNAHAPHETDLFFDSTALNVLRVLIVQVLPLRILICAHLTLFLLYESHDESSERKLEFRSCL